LATERVERKLAAILAADVAGYSRLMGTDEEGTLARLKARRRELADPKIKEHRGRIVKTTGDGLLLEFASVVDAVRCAVEVQREMAERNADVPSDRRIEFRMGINVGDIIKDGRDIYGDGVNVASRLEALAEPGGICVSRVVRDQVRDKLDFTFDDLGEQRVKNIARPIRVHRIRFAEETDIPYLRVSQPVTTPQLSLPDKPSVAVLPFTNMSGDPEQEFVSDGIAEDVITALSHYPSLFVIARNSTFTYKGRAVDVKQSGHSAQAGMAFNCPCVHRPAAGKRNDLTIKKSLSGPARNSTVCAHSRPVTKRAATVLKRPINSSAFRRRCRSTSFALFSASRCYSAVLADN
jgi:adenylate cyclase